MPSTDTSTSVESPTEARPERVRPVPEAPGEATSTPNEPTGDPGGFGDLIRDLADDTRTLVRQEVELVRLEVAHSAKRITTDGAWIGAGALVATVGLICLALAAALGIGALLDSYWLGTLITALAFLGVGGLFTWFGVRDLKAGGLMPSSPLESFEENREWARQELDELKKGIAEDT